MRTFLCVDSGTTVIKATLMDESLATLDEVKASVVVRKPTEGASEADMNEVWNCLCTVTRTLRSRSEAHWRALACVCVTGQGDGLWGVDSHGEPAGPALLWNDTRPRELCIDDTPLLDEVILRNHINPVYAGSVAALLKWLKLRRPDAFSRTARAMHCKDWINFKLTGEIATDPSDASTCGYDNKSGRYVRALYDVLDIPACASMLPEITPSTTIIGRITREAAGLTEIAQGVPVAEGCVDICAVALGSDVFRPLRCCTIIGTTLCSEIVLRGEDVDFDKAMGLLVRHAVPDLYMRVMPTLSGASCMDYIKSILFPDLTYPEMEAQLADLPIGSGGLIFHPYISGERAPIKNPFATAGFFGLTGAHSAHHMMRSVFEGLACSCFDCHTALDGKAESVYLSGGASASPMVCQMFSDMLGATCYRVEATEMGTKGAGRIAQVALGVKADFDSFPALPTRTFVPDEARHARYMRLFDLYKALQKGMASFWQERTGLI